MKMILNYPITRETSKIFKSLIMNHYIYIYRIPVLGNPSEIYGPNFQTEWEWPNSHLSGYEYWNISGITSHFGL